MGRLIAISNRTAADPKARAGGLAVAVWESLKATGGSWFGWSGELVDELPRGTNVFRDEGVEFVLTDLTHDEHQAYYLNYANRVIWPVFHYRLDLASFDSEAFTVYSAVNQRIANLVADRLTPTDTVWVHDYHFLLMGDALRHAGWEGPTGFFLHIPFPPPEMFRAIPEHHWIARALCAYSVIGFQSERDRANFERYLVDDCGGKALEDGRISVFETTTRIAAYPIGIDPEGFVNAAHSPEADRAAERISRFLGGREFVIGVDRMDYSKGLPQRFEAVGQLFDDHPELHGKVSVTQIAPPSRSKVEEYQELRLELDQLAGRINGDHGDLDWIPLRYLARSYTREELAGLFRIARVGLAACVGRPVGASSLRTRNRARATTTAPAARARNRLRQWISDSSHSSGDVAARAPSPPKIRKQPFAKARRCGSKRRAIIMKADMSAPETPTPMVARATVRRTRPSAIAKSAAPLPATSNRTLWTLAGPKRSSRMPSGTWNRAKPRK